MVGQILTVAFQGLHVRLVTVQVQVSTSALPSFQIVGLPDKAVAESRERVRSALISMGLSLPAQRITVNLAPADIQKEGNHYDLPIALGVLERMGLIPQEELSGFIALGELGLDGGLAPVQGTLSAAIAASSQDKGLICPASSGGEAAWAEGIQILAPATLGALVNHFKGTQVLTPPRPSIATATEYDGDLQDVRGQESAKRALEIAAAGGHNLLMTGPPGSGKSMLAARLPGILPPLSPAEALEVTMIYSIAGALTKGQLIRHRPYRAPHHSASLPALIGGGIGAKPGEISLAHRGVLFLDELPEFSGAALESLRQPLETGHVCVSRVNARAQYPARFQFIGAMNPCRCGYGGADTTRSCNRMPHCMTAYQNRLSGPLLDRMDLHIAVQSVSPKDLRLPPASENSAAVARRVVQARLAQEKRYAALPESILTNSDMTGERLMALCPLVPEADKLLLNAADIMGLSARAFHRVIKVARTIADLEQAPMIEKHHVAEALSYRQTASA